MIQTLWVVFGDQLDPAVPAAVGLDPEQDRLRFETSASGVVAIPKNYRFRDWLFSRQRYWGEPFPIVHWEDGTIGTLEESELPLQLPEVEDYKPSEGGESPLARAAPGLGVPLARHGDDGENQGRLDLETSGGARHDGMPHACAIGDVLRSGPNEVKP